MNIAEYGIPSVNAAPTTTLGYDTFGNQTHFTDQRGNTTTASFDSVDRRVAVTHPTYTPPSGSSAITPVETFGDDAVGNLTQRTDRAWGTTDFGF